MGVELGWDEVGALIASFHVRPTLLDRLREAQLEDVSLNHSRELAVDGSHPEFSLGADGTLLYRNRLCVPSDPDLKHEILEEAHCSAYAMHPGSTKNVSYHTRELLVDEHEERNC